MSVRVVSYAERIFADRAEAGRVLAAELMEFRDRKTLILGIPRGGVVIAGEIAETLGAEMDILLSRKLGAPDAPELAIGAVTEDGTVFLNDQLIEELSVPRAYIEEETGRQKREITRRVALFRTIRPRAPMAGRTVVVTDDGAATGATLQAALWSCRHENPQKLVCAFPSGSEQAVARLSREADLLVALSVPAFFAAVSQSYARFPQVTDEEVVEILRNETRRHADHDRRSREHIGKNA